MSCCYATLRKPKTLWSYWLNLTLDSTTRNSSFTITITGPESGFYQFINPIAVQNISPAKCLFVSSYTWICNLSTVGFLIDNSYAPLSIPSIEKVDVRGLLCTTSTCPLPAPDLNNGTTTSQFSTTTAFPVTIVAIVVTLIVAGIIVVYMRLRARGKLVNTTVPQSSGLNFVQVEESLIIQDDFINAKTKQARFDNDIPESSLLIQNNVAAVVADDSIQPKAKVKTTMNPLNYASKSKEISADHGKRREFPIQLKRPTYIARSASPVSTRITTNQAGYVRRENSKTRIPSKTCQEDDDDTPLQNLFKK